MMRNINPFNYGLMRGLGLSLVLYHRSSHYLPSSTVVTFVLIKTRFISLLQYSSLPPPLLQCLDYNTISEAIVGLVKKKG